jgi:sorting nexin-25
MVLHRRDLVLAGVFGFIAWGLVVRWLPILRYLGWALALGAALSCAGLLALVVLTIRKPSDKLNPPKAVSVAFITPNNWRRDVLNIRKSTRYRPRPLYPQSFVVSEEIDGLLSLITRDFIYSWYHNISPNPTFANEIDRTIRVALENFRDRLLSEDMISLIVSRIFPILTAHLKEFDIAERQVRGRNLNRNVTESEELDLAVAKKYREGRLHPAVALSTSDQKQAQQEYLRKISVGLLPQLFPESVLNSRAVSVLIREIISCAVLFPILSSLSDPDTWNQLMEAYGRTALQDRKTVRKLRAALDEHASPVPKSKRGQPFPRLSPSDSERAFERFVRAIRRCNNLSDARRFRALVTSQLKRESMVEGQDQVYLRRLETGKRVLDQKVAKLSVPGEASRRLAEAVKPRRDSAAAPETSLVDVMHSASGLSYFMEFMDRQKLMSLVQFWIVVDGFRDPLEDDFGDDTSSASGAWTTADRNDMALLSETYLNKPELKVSDDLRRAVKAFLSAGKRATPEQYRKARTAVLTTQSAILEEMESKYYPKFKESDLYWKYLASDEASAPRVPVDHQSSPLAVTFDAPERPPLPPLIVRTSSQPGARPSKDLRRAAVSSSDVRGMGKLFDDDDSPRRSVDSERSGHLFDDDYDTDNLAASTASLGKDSQNGDNDASQSQVLETMEAALNDIITNEPKNSRIEDLKGSGGSSSSLFDPDILGPPRRSSTDSSRVEGRPSEKKKSIATLGLVGHGLRHGVFDDDLFPDQKQYPEDEYEEPVGEDKDPADEVHEAAPGDLGLTEAIEALTTDIDKLNSQDAVLEALRRKAELTNNTAELRILRKSKASIEREIHRKEMQRQQYIIQESDNSLYGRSTVRIKSIVVGKEEDDGREFAMCKFTFRLLHIRL